MRLGSSTDARPSRGLFFKVPLAFSSAGKVSSAWRDLAPLIFLGVGAALDSAVLASMVGLMIASVSIATVSAVSLPFLATGDPRARRVETGFVGLFLLISVAAIILTDPFLKVLGLESAQPGVRLLYTASVCAGFLQAVTSVFMVRLYAMDRFVGLAMPFFAGILLLLAAFIPFTLGVLATALLVGALLDLLLVWTTSKRHVGHGAHRTLSRGSISGGFSLIALNQAIIFVIIVLDRSLMSRAAAGTVGVVALASRFSFAIVALLAGSLEPQIMRLVAARAKGASDMATRLAALSVRAGLALFVVLAAAAALSVQLDLGIVASSVIAFGLGTVTAVLVRLLRTVLVGSRQLRLDVGLSVLGGFVTIGIGVVALRTNNDYLFAFAVPISTTVLALAAGVIVQSTHGPVRV